MKKKRNPYFYPRSDSGNAELFAVLYRDTVRFDHKQGRWLLWNEGRWTEDKQEKVRAMMKQAARRRHELVFDLSDSEERTRQIKWALQSESRYAIDAALELAKSEPNISDDGERWDANPMLLGVANGIVDLPTGQFRTATQGDLITKFSPVVFYANAECPRFEQFLEEIFDGDQDRIHYIQKAIGYTLTGSVEEHCLFGCFGSGRNGKSTLLEVLLYVMGDYGVDLPFGTLETKHQIGEGANLPGARFAKAVEIREGRRLDEARVKSWTGGDTISVRPLYRNAFSFSPTHKLWLAFNHKPVVADNSPAIWNRIHLIPFERNFAKLGADKKLLVALKAEAPGILNWAIEGCLKWQSEGLKVPTAVEQATREYEQESDPIGPFLAECCEQQPEFQVPKGELWNVYQKWCSEPLSRKAFVEKMRSRGFGERNTRITRFWTGVRLKAGDTSDACDTNFRNSPTRKSYIEVPKTCHVLSPCHTWRPSLTRQEAIQALRAQGIRKPSRQLVEDYLRVQQAEEWALEVPEPSSQLAQAHKPTEQEAHGPNPAEPREMPHPSSNSNLEPLLRERGELQRPAGRRKAGRPRIVASFYPALARVMADQTPLPKALRILGIHLDQRQVRALYRSREFKAMYQEARRQFLADYGKRSTQQLRKMRRYAGL